MQNFLNAIQVPDFTGNYIAIDQQQKRNALAQQDQQMRQQSAQIDQSYKNALIGNMSSDNQRSADAAQHQQAMGWLTNGINAARQNPAVIPQLVQEGKRRGYIPPDVPDDVGPEHVEELATRLGLPPPPMPFNKTPDAQKLSYEADLRANQAKIDHGYKLGEISASGDQTRRTNAEKPSAALDLSPEGIDLAAQEYLNTGKLPSGMGKAASGINAKLISRAAEMARASGDDAKAATLGRASFIAAKTGLAALTKQRTLVGAFERTALKNLEIAVSESAKVDRTGIPVMNRWLNAGKKNLGGDVEVGRFNAALTSALNEYAKVLSGATGASGITDAARKEAEELISTASTPEQIVGIVDIMKREMANREAGFAEQEAQLKETMSGRPSVSVAPAETGAPVAPGAPARQPAAAQPSLDELVNKYAGH